MRRVLVDTTVWVDHFRRPNAPLVTLLAQDEVAINSMALGEAACGTPPSRRRTPADLQRLQSGPQASVRKVMSFVERERLYGLGCGWVDLSLLASTLITTGAILWTLDRRLAALALRFDVGYRPAAG